MKRLLLVLGVLVLLLAALGAGVLWYIRPERQLDLAYQPIDIREKVASIVRTGDLSVTVTDDELESLLKQEISRNPHPVPGLTLTGAAVARTGEELTVDLAVRFQERVPIGVRVIYRMAWESPTLTLTFVEARVKNRPLPADWLDIGDWALPLGDAIPGPAHIRSIDFSGPTIRIALGLL